MSSFISLQYSTERKVIRTRTLFLKTSCSQLFGDTADARPFHSSVNADGAATPHAELGGGTPARGCHLEALPTPIYVN
ncbi:hypothetical protein EVAR_25402_1 [Eumeta japonica]|uniref:Uncharacterized protein n=1 Tax=Eumeta variegata TaxID=151549 RepID=A0A4C1V4T9_EUMVA|nr:hypothetical protein EVAR_25402_1 [Eumeta japonica]